MKGVNKHVVEIIEPQNEYIERVVVYLRQDKGDVGIALAQKEAEDYAHSIVCWRRGFWATGKKAVQTLAGIALGVLALAVLALVFM